MCICIWSRTTPIQTHSAAYLCVAAAAAAAAAPLWVFYCERDSGSGNRTHAAIHGAHSLHFQSWRHVYDIYNILDVVYNVVELEGRSLTSNSNSPRRFQSPIKFYFFLTHSRREQRREKKNRKNDNSCSVFTCDVERPHVNTRFSMLDFLWFVRVWDCKWKIDRLLIKWKRFYDESTCALRYGLCYMLYDVLKRSEIW